VQRSETFPDILVQPERWGRHVESAIGAHLLNSSRTGNFKVFYWRHRNDEVDFVLEKNGLAVGLEVKSGRKQQQGGMKAFSEAFHPHKIYLIGGTGIPWQDFLKINPEDLF
jgi:predicted AAA+ superfamily ATPase